MENKFRHQTPRLTDASTQKVSGRNLPHPPERTAPTNVQNKIAAIEQQILSHPSLAAHMDVVNVYLAIGKYQLEPISWLRQEGLWRSVDPMTMHEMSLRLPQRDQYEALRDVQPSLFDSPPSDLFDLICQYRWFTNFQSTDIIAKLEESTSASDQRPMSKYEAGRTAPDGYKYPCPSRGCRKEYAKSGHLRNHINQNHPDFLRLHPEWKPYCRPVDTGSSDSSSPSSERHPTQPSEETQLKRTQRPLSTDWVYPSNDALPGSPMAVDFMEDFERTPPARLEREPYLTAPTYRERGSQSHRSRHMSPPIDPRRANRGFKTFDAQLGAGDNEESSVRAIPRNSNRQPQQSSKDKQYGSGR